MWYGTCEEYEYSKTQHCSARRPIHICSNKPNHFLSAHSAVQHNVHSSCTAAHHRMTLLANAWRTVPVTIQNTPNTTQQPLIFSEAAMSTPGAAADNSHQCFCELMVADWMWLLLYNACTTHIQCTIIQLETQAAMPACAPWGAAPTNGSLQPTT